MRGLLRRAGFGTICMMCAFAGEVCGKEASFAGSAFRFWFAICLSELRLPRNIGQDRRRANQKWRFVSSSHQIYENVNKSSKKIRDCDAAPSGPTNFATVAGPDARIESVSTSRRRVPFLVAFLVAIFIIFRRLRRVGVCFSVSPRLCRGLTPAKPGANGVAKKCGHAQRTALRPSVIACGG